MIKERLIAAATRCYQYVSGLLLGQPSVRMGHAGTGSGRRSGNMNRVDLPLPDTRNVLSLAWPLAVNAIMLNGIVIVDTFLVSTLGEGALASMGLAAAIISLLLGTLSALSTATQILVAQGQGANDRVRLKSAFWSGLVMNTAASVFCLALVWVIGDKIITYFAHTPLIAEDAISYLHVFTVVVIAETLSQSVSCYFNGTGRTKLPFYSHLVEIPVNIGLSIVLIYGLYGFPEFGLTGAAIGSAAAAAVRMLFLVWCIFKRDRSVICVAGWSQTTLARSSQRHFILALPIAATFFSQSVASVVCTLLYARLTISQFAAMTLIMPWIQVFGQFMTSWAQATGIFVGQLLGQRVSASSLDDFLSRVWRFTFALAALVSLLYLGASLSFDWLYDDLLDETRDALWSFVPVLLVLSFPKSSNAICGHTLRAGGDTVYVMNIFIFSQWAVRVPLTAFFILYLNTPVAWVFALFLAEELVKFPLFHRRLYSGKWRTVYR